ncbi:MAG: TIGR00304 family membrane protein [Candidatus Thorarchaeota archaeon]
MIQLDFSITQIAYFLIIAGIVAILIGVASIVISHRRDPATSIESKGIILLGPIPIIWGYGKKVQIALIIIGIALVLTWYLIVFRGLNNM